MMYKIFDDLLPSGLVNRIDRVVNSDQFKWYALDNLSSGDQEKKFEFVYKDGYKYKETWGLTNLLFMDNNWYDNHQLFLSAQQIVDYVQEKEGFNLHRISRVKVNLLTNHIDKTFDNMSINLPHLDAHYKHKVLVYYVDDSDGDTILFNEKWKEEDFKNTVMLSTEARVAPKRGRILMFDGLQYHTSQNPIQHKYRSIININIVTQDDLQ